MIEEHIQKKCSQCGRKHDAPGNVCFICMRNAITGGSTPQRVGIARKGDLVILESLQAQTPEDKCKIADVLGTIREEMGIRFIMLDASTVRLARAGEYKRVGQYNPNESYRMAQQFIDENEDCHMTRLLSGLLNQIDFKDDNENAGRTDNGT